MAAEHQEWVDSEDTCGHATKKLPHLQQAFHPGGFYESTGHGSLGDSNIWVV